MNNWKDMDFVVGYEIRLSNNPKHKTEICKALAGKYPKWFKWNGCDENCRCTTISILKTDEEIEKDDIRIFQGKEPLQGSINTVKDVPDGFKKWIRDNVENINSMPVKPQFILANFIDGDVKKGLKH